MDLFRAETMGSFISGQIWALAELAQLFYDEIPRHHMSILKNVLKIIM